MMFFSYQNVCSTASSGSTPVGDEHASPGLLVHLLGRKLEKVIMLIHELFPAFAVLVVLQCQNEALPCVCNLHDHSPAEVSRRVINTEIQTTTTEFSFHDWHHEASRHKTLVAFNEEVGNVAMLDAVFREIKAIH